MHEGKKDQQNSQNLSNWEASVEDDNHTSEGREEWLRQSLDVRVYSFCLVNKIQRGKKKGRKPVEEETRQNREGAKGVEAGKKVFEGADDRGTPSDVWDRAKEDKVSVS